MVKDTNEQEETITMSKTDYAKAIQSAEDKLRTTYSSKIKDLESKLPHEKSDAEKDYQQRLAALEQKEKRIAMQESLAKNKLDNSLADYLKDDADIDSFNTTIDTLVKQRITDAGFKPNGHTANVGISKDQWAKMSYSQKQEFYNSNPELANKFMGM
jgi:transketolase